MSWKKNVFSCLMWVVYLLLVGTAMIFTGRVICDFFGMAEYYELVIPAAYLLFTGILVLVLHRSAVKLGVDSRKEGKAPSWIEGILVLALFAAGMFLRWTEIQSESFAVPDGSVYLELSYISTDGQGIPQFAHGAVYLYLWGLRLCFMVLGNKAAAAVWLQIALQMLSVLLLHFAVRKMAGRIPAVMMVAFFMLTPFMVEKSLVPSPDMLYLLCFSFVLLLVSQGVKYRFGWGFWLAAGVMAAVMIYLDVAGLLLLPLMLGVIVMKRPDDGGKSVGGLPGCLLGLLAGAAGCVSADVMSSGKTFSGIIRAWGNLYLWEDIQLSVTLSGFDMVWMITLILCLMAWGIFSFWCGRGVDRFTVWTFCLSIAVLLQCLGIFTQEMSGACYIFLFSTILAGLGIRESMAVYPAEETEELPEDEAALEIIDISGDETVLETADISGDETALEMIDIFGDGAGLETEGISGDGAGLETEGIFGDGAVLETEGSSKKVAAGGIPKREQKHIVKEERGMAEEKDKPESRDRLENRDHTEQKAAGTEETPEKKRKIEFLENPLPLPKKHVKRVMDYKLDSDRRLDGYDIAVAEDDDFDH